MYSEKNREMDWFNISSTKVLFIEIGEKNRQYAEQTSQKLSICNDLTHTRIIYMRSQNSVLCYAY